MVFTVQAVCAIALQQTLHLNLALTGDCAFLFSLKKTHSVWFISIWNYGGHWKFPHKSPSPCNTYVIPMSLYKFVSLHKPHKHAHTSHTHTHTPVCRETFKRIYSLNNFKFMLLNFLKKCYVYGLLYLFHISFLSSNLSLLQKPQSLLRRQ